MHQDSLQLQACQNPLDDQKRKSQDRDTLKSSLIDALRHVDQKLPIFQERFWAIIFSLDRNDINNFGPKDHLSKTIPILRSDAPIWKAFYGTCRCPEQMSQKNNEKRTKEKMIVMSCTWKIRLSLNENQECQKNAKKKMMKNCINTNHFSPARNHSSV